jgi:hypothetical protein
MADIKSGNDSPPGKHCFRELENSRPDQTKENEMFGMKNDLHSHRVLMIFFACVSGLSVVSMAVVPGIGHI